MDIGIGVHLFQGIVAVVVGFKVDCEGVHGSPGIRMRGTKREKAGEAEGESALLCAS
jgi:hypothetical protein